MLLEIKNLHANVEGREILRGVDLALNAGEVHAIMGPNGSGKSTLASVLAGREEYEVTAGEILYKGQNLLEMDPEIRAREGIFMAFQYPVEIPGVSNTYFLKAALNNIRKHQGLPELDAFDFLELVREKMKLMEMDQALLNRPVNTGFSSTQAYPFSSSSRASSLPPDRTIRPLTRTWTRSGTMYFRSRW